MLEAKILKKVVLLRQNPQETISNIFITASKRELGRKFHSLQSISREWCVIHVAYVS